MFRQSLPITNVRRPAVHSTMLICINLFMRKKISMDNDQLPQSRKNGLHTPSLLCTIVLQIAGCHEPCKNITNNKDQPTSMLRPAHASCHCDIILSFSYQAKSVHVAQLQKLGFSSGSIMARSYWTTALRQCMLLHLLVISESFAQLKS
jgi:hypothetical protein